VKSLFQILEEHVGLVDAIEARNEEEALAALAHHLHTSEYVIAD
jgi:DNA-binding GntR family transcriptional regulator